VRFLAQMSESDLQAAGVHARGARLALLDAARGLRVLADRARPPPPQPM
jgi:hypothetical protein